MGHKTPMAHGLYYKTSFFVSNPDKLVNIWDLYQIGWY